MLLLLLLHLLAAGMSALVHHLLLLGLLLLLHLGLLGRRRNGLVGVDERLVVEVEHDATASRFLGRSALQKNHMNDDKLFYCNLSKLLKFNQT